MTRLTIGAALLCVALSLPAFAQEPVAGARFHIQLVAGDTGVVAGERDPRLISAKSSSTIQVRCVQPDSGKWLRESRECGPRVRFRVLADTTVTADAQGHVLQRLAWAGGDAVVELEASDPSTAGSNERIRLKVGFWPRLAHGAAAPPETALRMTNAAATYGHLVSMTVFYKDGSQAVLVLPERGAP